MRKAVSVQMITTTGCDRCREVEERLVYAAKKAGVILVMQYIDSSTDEAIHLGIQHGLDDVPSLVISGQPFCGTDFSDQNLIDTMMKACS